MEMTREYVATCPKCAAQVRVFGTPTQPRLFAHPVKGEVAHDGKGRTCIGSEMQVPPSAVVAV